MKALVGKQGNLPEHLKKAILDAPAKKTDKTKGKRLSEKEVANFKSDMGKYSPTITSSEKSLGGPSQGPPATDLEGNVKKAGSKLARGGKVLSTKDIHPSGKRQSKTRQRVRQVTYSDSPNKLIDTKKGTGKNKKVKKAVGPKMKIEDGYHTKPKSKRTKVESAKNYRTGKSAIKMTDAELKKNKETLDYRQGKGRADVTKKGSVVKGSTTRKLGEGMGPSGTKKAGSAGTRVVKQGHTSAGTKTGSSQYVVKEKKASEIKKRGYNFNNKKSASKSPAKMYGKKKK